jgi:hypothetical protein
MKKWVMAGHDLARSRSRRDGRESLNNGQAADIMDEKPSAPPTQVRPFFRFLAMLNAAAFAVVLIAALRETRLLASLSLVDAVFFILMSVPALLFFVFAANGARMPKRFAKGMAMASRGKFSRFSKSGTKTLVDNY